VKKLRGTQVWVPAVEAVIKLGSSYLVHRLSGNLPTTIVDSSPYIVVLAVISRSRTRTSALKFKNLGGRSSQGVRPRKKHAFAYLTGRGRRTSRKWNGDASSVNKPIGSRQKRQFGKLKKIEKIPYLQQKSITFLEILRNGRGHVPLPPRQDLGRFAPKKSYGPIKKISILRADPQIGGGIRKVYRGISSVWGLLPYGIKISAKISKMGEILRGK